MWLAGSCFLQSPRGAGSDLFGLRVRVISGDIVDVYVVRTSHPIAVVELRLMHQSLLLICSQVQLASHSPVHLT
jgi:hypothetical protein